jgi:hypothetical protein
MQSSRGTLLFLVMVLILASLPGCSQVAPADAAVCQAYQHLIDVWPSTSEEIKAASSLDEIWVPITEAGQALITASKAAHTDKLGELGQAVGEVAAGFTDRNAKTVNQGFVPFFTETLLGGKELSGMCEQMGQPVTLTEGQ